jgi:hypothetical protein
MLPVFLRYKLNIIKSSMNHYTVRDILSMKKARGDVKPVVAVEAHTCIEDAIQELHSHHLTSLVVFGKAAHFVASGDPSLTTHKDRYHSTRLPQILYWYHYALGHSQLSQHIRFHPTEDWARSCSQMFRIFTRVFQSLDLSRKSRYQKYYRSSWERNP